MTIDTNPQKILQTKGENQIPNKKSENQVPIKKMPKELTASAQKRLDRKRQAARLRQQRCRARKRAAAAAAAEAEKQKKAAQQSIEKKVSPSSAPGSASPTSKRARTNSASIPTPASGQHHTSVLATPVNGIPRPLVQGTNSGETGQSGYPSHYYMNPWYPHGHNPWMFHAPHHMPGYPSFPGHQQPHPIPPSAQPGASSKLSMTPPSNRSRDDSIQPLITASTPKSTSPLRLASLPFTSPMIPTPSIATSLLGPSANQLPVPTPIKASKELSEEVWLH